MSPSVSRHDTSKHNKAQQSNGLKFRFSRTLYQTNYVLQVSTVGLANRFINYSV
jgi:hypothetical protein